MLVALYHWSQEHPIITVCILSLIITLFNVYINLPKADRKKVREEVYKGTFGRIPRTHTYVTGQLKVSPQTYKCLCDRNRNGSPVSGYCHEHRTDWI